jgi:hypothetical protein
MLGERGAQASGNHQPRGSYSIMAVQAGADELAAAGDTVGAAVWCRMIDAVDQLANTTRPGPLH